MTVKVGTLSADLDLDGNPFERNLDRAMATGAQKATQIGDKMTAGVTLPLVAAGGVAVKMGMDFETSMSRMVGLVGLTTAEVDELQSGIMDLSGETAKAPQELADAMFTVTSAGFRGAEAMDVLTSAAKASAAGLGETRTIAEALTGAVNAYGPEVLDAARATDILVATARAGNFESSQLAGVLGKITPFAKQAGASLEDVGGAIALLTRVNNNATESGTQVAAMMRAFVAPGAEAVNTFEDLYGSTQAFRDIIARDGVVAALNDLDGKLGGSREELARLLGSSEAASAAFQILDADAETIAGTFGTVTDSVGMTDEAFQAATETAEFKMQKALSHVKIALIEAGEYIAPFVTSVAGGLSTVAEAFAAMPGPVQKLVVGFAGLLAAVGPIASIGGRIAQNWQTLGRAFDKAATAAYGASGKIGTLGKVVGGLAIAAVAYELYQMAEAARQVEVNMGRASRAGTDELVEDFKAFSDAAGDTAGLEAFQQMAEGNIGTARRLRDGLAALGEDTTALDDILRDAAEGERQMAADGEVAAGAVDGLASSLNDLTPRAADGAGEIEELGEAGGDAAGEIDDLTDAIDSFDAALRNHLDPLWATQDALRAHAEAQDAVKGAQLEALAASDEYTKAVKEHGKGSEEATDAAYELERAQEAVDDANRDVVRSAMDVSSKTAELAMMMETGRVSIEDAEAQLRLWVAQGVITEEQAAQVSRELRGTAGAADALDGRNVAMGVNLTGFQQTIARLDELARRANTPLVFNASIRAREAAAEGRWTGGPTLVDKDYIAGEDGPELIRMSGGAGVVENAGRTRNMLAGATAGAGGSSSRAVTYDIDVHYPPDVPSTEAIGHELHMLELGNP